MLKKNGNGKKIKIKNEAYTEMRKNIHERAMRHLDSKKTGSNSTSVKKNK